MNSWLNVENKFYMKMTHKMPCSTVNIPHSLLPKFDRFLCSWAFYVAFSLFSRTFQYDKKCHIYDMIIFCWLLFDKSDSHGTSYTLSARRALYSNIFTFWHAFSYFRVLSVCLSHSLVVASQNSTHYYHLPPLFTGVLFTFAVDVERWDIAWS